MALSSQHLLIFCVTSIILWRHAYGGYTPLYTANYNTRSNETGRGQVFPDFSSTSTSTCSSVNIVSHFLSELNFDAVNNRILVGAADNLYLLGKDLSCASNYSWPTATGSLTTCLTDNIGSDQNSTCRNHIRTYKAFPSDSSRLLVCGTQAGVTPECRTVTVSGGSFSSDTRAVTASNGLVSYYPEFSGFGEFRRNGMSSDSTFFAAGFHRGTQGVGRDYNISYHSVQYNSATSSLTLSEQFSTKDSDFWLKHPVTFVDYYRADYTGIINGVPTAPSDYQFFFVFLRESLVGVSGYDVIYSRVVRICRNDGGINGQFSTYLKARIYCEREVPPGRDFNGAIDYQYNELQSMVFNDNGRFSENGRWVKMMYGAFSGPSIGPQGTAICAYRADNSIVTDGISFGYNRGIFDIFRDNVVVTAARNPDGTFPEEENGFVECAAGGRTAEDSEKVIIAQDVKQIGEDPLVVFDGLTVTQMAVDQVCVVSRTNPLQCHNQDVLFLGTDNGKIMKVVFVLEDGRELTPVIAEEITLDDLSEDNQVRELRIENHSGEKFIYATTRSKIFRLPLQRCSRFNGQGCQRCLGSKDPYCVWNVMSGECEANLMTVDGSGQGVVSTNIWQNISSGAVTQCQASPVCDLTASTIDHGAIMCTVECNNTIQVTFSSDISGATTRDCDNNLNSSPPSNTQNLDSSGRACIQFTGANGFNTYECRASISNGLLFTQRTMTPPGPPLQLFDDNITTEVTQRSFRVCVVVEDLTDEFYNYQLGVIIGSNTMTQSFTAGTCIWIRSQTPGSTVNYRVQVSNSIGTTTSPMATVRLLAGVPGVCGSLMSTAISNVSVSLNWTAPQVTNGDITGYSVSVDDREVIGCVSLMTTSYTVDGLQPFTSYSIGVRACTSAGAGESVSSNFQTTCGRPGRIQNLMLTPTSNSIRGTWGSPTATFGTINNYEVTVTCDTMITVQRSNEEYVRSPISPLTDCCFSVAAINTCNGVNHIGLPTEMCTTTLDVNPGVVQDLTATSISSSSLLFEWRPPANYQRPGLMYMVTINDDMDGNIFSDPISSAYYFADNLNANSAYTITVQARTNSTPTSMSSQTSLTATTSPSVPNPPQTVNLVFRQNTFLDLSWPDSNQVNFNTTQYRVVWRCDNYSDETNTQSQSYSVRLPQEAVEFSWCTAKVQSINNVGISEFSELASIVIPPMSPQQPTCYFVSDNGGSVTISFTVTDPFLINDLSYNWTLRSTNGEAITKMNSSVFANTNTIDIGVLRNANYSFELQLCNSVGCSDYCPQLVFFTGLNPPLPPTEISFSEIDCCSASISWGLPPGEQEGGLNYAVGINGPCLSEPMLADPAESSSDRSAIVTGLCPGTNYTVVVQAIEPTFNIRGRFSQAFTLTTLPGSPSAPRSVVARYTVTDTLAKQFFISVYWAAPAVHNGVLVMYEVLWANFEPSDKPNCNQLQDTLSATITNLTALEYTVSNPMNIEPSAVKNIMVCVRAYTGSSEPGEWGSGSVNEAQFTLPTSSGLSDPAGGECNNLIVVAVIAGVAILSSFIVGIILAFVIYKNGWTLCLKGKKEDKVEDSEHQPKDLKHPPYTNRTNSMKPLMINGE